MVRNMKIKHHSRKTLVSEKYNNYNIDFIRVNDVRILGIIREKGIGIYGRTKKEVMEKIKKVIDK